MWSTGNNSEDLRGLLASVLFWHKWTLRLAPSGTALCQLNASSCCSCCCPASSGSCCWLMDCLQCEGGGGRAAVGHWINMVQVQTITTQRRLECTTQFVSVCLLAFIPSPSMHTHTHTLGMSFSIIRDEWHTLQNVLDTGQFTFSMPGKMWIGRGRSCLKLLHMDAKCRRREHTGKEGKQDNLCSTHVANRLSQWCKGDRACACFCNEGPSGLLRPPRDAEKQRTVFLNVLAYFSIISFFFLFFHSFSIFLIILTMCALFVCFLRVFLFVV